MPRVVSLYLPTWPTDRLRKAARTSASPVKGAARPVVIFLREAARDVVTAVDAQARTRGLYPGLDLTQARILAADLVAIPADPVADRVGLERLATWAVQRYSPVVAPDGDDGLLLDITGVAHLHGGETRLLETLLARVRRFGLAARAAVADTPAAAWAVARHGAADLSIIPPGGTREALADLPVAALRLPSNIFDGLRLLGIERIAALYPLPRAPLVLRFGPAIALRLDQALGRAAEPLQPFLPPDVPQVRLAFVEPLLTAESLTAAMESLVATLCRKLGAAGRGVRRLDLLFRRVDGVDCFIRIGTAAPTRDGRHLMRLLAEKLGTVEPGFGVEVMILLALRTDPLGAQQIAGRLGGEVPVPDMAALVDRLVARLGAGRVYRLAPVESDVPERAVGRIAPLARPGGKAWPAHLPRPARLLKNPEPVETLGLLPDHPPVRFTWRGRHFDIRKADGPERVHGEWWKARDEVIAIRDYFQVEDVQGRRFWLFRRGDGATPATGSMRWFIHGFFG